MSVQSSIDIDNPKQTIQTCFKMMHYVVPAFQREYVWEEAQIELLLSDIEEAYERDSNKEYFLGTTVVYKNDEKMQLIDGQQRMTTFFLVLCAIAKKYVENHTPAGAFENLINTPTVDSNGNTINSYTLELQYEESSKCLSNIWEDKIPDEKDDLPLSSLRIYNAYETISKRLSADYPVFSEYKKFAAYFISKIVFIQIGATNISDALKIFETINQRGVSLNPMDLLKNLLFMHVSEAQFEKLNGKWKSMIDGLEEIGEKPLRFLRYYITATYDISDVKKDNLGIINDDEVYSWLSTNNDKCHYKESPINFTDDMIKGLIRYKSFLNPSADFQGRDYLIDIKTIMGKSFRLHLVPLLAWRGNDSDLREKFFKVLDIVIFYAVINNIKSNVLEKLLSSWCPDIRAISDEHDLNAFIVKKVKPTISNWNIEYQDKFMQLSLASIQKYKIKTILARLAKYVDSYRANDLKNAANIESYMKSANEVEHTMPVNCVDYSQYNVESKEEYDRLKERLGNLTLLEKTLNSSIQDGSYQSKQLAYLNSSFYLTESIVKKTDVGNNTAINEMNAKLQSWTSWNKLAIEKRQEMLCTLSKEVFDIDSLVSDDNTIL